MRQRLGNRMLLLCAVRYADRLQMPSSLKACAPVSFHMGVLTVILQCGLTCFSSQTRLVTM